MLIAPGASASMTEHLRSNKFETYAAPTGYDMFGALARDFVR